MNMYLDFKIIIPQVDDEKQLRILREHHQRSLTCCSPDSTEPCKNKISMKEIRNAITGFGRTTQYYNHQNENDLNFKDKTQNTLFALVEGEIGNGTANGLIRAFLDGGEVWFHYIKDARKHGYGVTFRSINLREKYV
mmetsp:Transcript_31756/g.48708  ORF Transcript_31756/g.48708 Transcript_31756/m.48708 type:complete len:137 (+) Transcript_31756:625-1035(+)